MNYLAHIYLSGENELVKIGNFMADSIRGKQYLNYPIDIQKGILLHREIDTYTDSNTIYRISKHRLHEKYGHYSGVIMDIFYDHFLAKNWKNYHNQNLEAYTENFYHSLQANYEILTEKTKIQLPYMIDRNWLLSYSSIAGLEIILFQMDYRTQNRVNMQESIIELEKFYTDFENEFTEFFKQLKHFCNIKLTEIDSKFI